MRELHVHLDGSPADHPDWGPDVLATERSFDAAALERAITDARSRAYAELLELNAA